MVNDSIVLDTTPPKGTILINDGAKITSNSTITLTINASDASGLKDMKVADNKYFPGQDWRPFNTTIQWVLSHGTGECTIYIKFRSMLGQESDVASDSIILDTLAPTMTVAIAGGAAYTNISSVTLQLNYSENYWIESMQVSNDPSFNGSIPELFSCEKGWNLLQGDGIKTVYARATDTAGNVGRAANATIILDTTPPNSSISQLPIKSNTTDFRVNWSGADPTSPISFFDVQYCDGGGAWTDWLVRTNQTCAIFSGSDGHNYSFRVRAQDKAGNSGEYPQIGSPQVQVSLPPPPKPPKPPVVTIVWPTANITIKGTKEIIGTSNHPENGMKVKSVLIRIDGGPPEPVNGTANWSLILDTRGLDDGPHTLIAQAYDGSRYSDNVTLVFIVSNNGGGPITSSGGQLPWFAVVAIIVGAVAVLGSVALFMVRRKKSLP
jgi:hypothetical protein